MTRGLYAGAAAAQRAVEALRLPGELIERLAIQVDALPLFQEEALLAGLFRSLGLDAALGGVLDRAEAPPAEAGRVAGIPRVPSRRSGNGAEPPLGVDFGPPVRSSGSRPEAGLRRADLPGSGVEAAPGSSGVPSDSSPIPLQSRDSEGHAGQQAYATDASQRRIRAKTSEGAAADEPAATSNEAGHIGRDLSSQPGEAKEPVEASWQPLASVSTPSLPEFTDSGRRSLPATAFNETAPILPDPQAVRRGLHQPILIRENPPIDLTPRHRPAPASATAANWSAKLEASLTRLETVRATAAAEHSAPDSVDLFGQQPTGLRRLAALGRPTTPRRRELPTSPAPALQPADLRQELAGILRREALRHGITPEEWEQ